MVSFRGLSAQIVCDGQSLEEYAATSTSGKESEVSCFIISESGKQFTIKLKHAGEIEELVTFGIFFDGTCIDQFLCRPNKERLVEGVQVSLTQQAPFHFSDIRLTEDDEGADVSHLAIGTIELRIRRMKSTKKVVTCPDRLSELKAQHLSGKPINETSKKSGSHQVILGDTVAVASGTSRVDCLPIDKHDTPYAIFKYHYRPKDILQAEGIIPLPNPHSALKRTAETAGLNLPESSSTMSKKQASMSKSHLKSGKLERVHPNTNSNSSNEITVIHDSDAEPDSDSEAEFETLKDIMELLQKRMSAMEKKRKSRKMKVKSEK